MAREADLGRGAPPAPAPRAAGEVPGRAGGGNRLSALWRFVNESSPS